MPRAIVIGVMGAGHHAHPFDLDTARAVGHFVAGKHWVLLTGGRDAGVMAEATRSAASNQGLTLGFLPGDSKSGAAPDLALALPTGLGHARNAINVLASDVVVVCGQHMGPGTLSELALAMKSGKPLIVIASHTQAMAFLEHFGYGPMFVTPSVDLALKHLEVEVEKITADKGFLPISIPHP